MAMQKKAEKAKREYAKPEVTRVKLVVEGPVLGVCWSQETTSPDSSGCQWAEGCYA